MGSSWPFGIPLEKRFWLLRCNITDAASCILRKSSSTSFVQRNKTAAQAVAPDSSAPGLSMPLALPPLRRRRPGKLLENCSA
jgi:hypothetical protein